MFTLAEALLYAVLRPGLSRTERLTAPLLAPLHAAMMFFVVHPATYRSLIGTRPTGGRTREEPAVAVPERPAPGIPHTSSIPNPRMSPGSSDAPSTPGARSASPPPSASRTGRTPSTPPTAPPPGPAKLLDPLTEKTLETPLRTRSAHPG